MTRSITIAKGDGIGPEIMDAVLKIILAAGADLDLEEISIGKNEYLAGHSTGISEHAWKTLKKNKILLKSPITTPQGGGYKSLNVTIRKTLGLFANVRPCISLHPHVQSKHPEMNLVIIRENEEDLYAGIEHQQTDEVIQCLKLISRPGCEKIIRYAFEYAKQNGRKKVTCFTKDNIMKQTDGLFHTIFNEVAKEYPSLQNDHFIVDIGAALLADQPERFDVIVMPNLYGDILSDVAAQITGSVGLAGSSNIGDEFALFEAIHGSAPDIAGENKANPSGLLHAAIMMLNHIGQNTVAEKIHNAWLVTLEQGIHTADIYKNENSKRKVGTLEFAEAVIQNLGKKPAQLEPVIYESSKPIQLPRYERKPALKKELVGVDIFVHWPGSNPNQLASQIKEIGSDTVGLSMITNRGIKVWPDGFEETFCTDHWRCRFKPASDFSMNQQAIIGLLEKAVEEKLDVIKIENLYEFDGKPAFSMGQGQ